MFEKDIVDDVRTNVKTRFLLLTFSFNSLKLRDVGFIQRLAFCHCRRFQTNYISYFVEKNIPKLQSVALAEFGGFPSVNLPNS